MQRSIVSCLGRQTAHRHVTEEHKLDLLSKCERIESVATVPYTLYQKQSSCTLTLALPNMQLIVINTHNNKRKKIRWVRVRVSAHKQMAFQHYDFYFVAIARMSSQTSHETGIGPFK